jgi:uncharacterized protein
VNAELEGAVFGAEAVRRNSVLDGRNADQQGVSVHPPGKPSLKLRLAAEFVGKVAVVIEHGAIANHVRRVARCVEFFGNLRVKDPELAFECGGGVHRERRLARNFSDKLDVVVGFFEQRADFVGESGLADAVSPDESELQIRRLLSNAAFVLAHFAARENTAPRGSAPEQCARIAVVLKILQDLLELQQVDAKLRDAQARLATIPKKSAEIDTRVAAAKAELEKSQAAKLAAVKDRKKYELDVEQWKEKVRKYRDQGSQVKTNEAYKALQHEVQMAEEEIAKAEDRLLEQMVAAEEYDRRIKTSEKALKEVEEATRGERAKIEAEKAAGDKESAAVTAERNRVLADIPEDMLDHYTRIAKKHNGVSLAEVRDEKCSACGMRVRPHVFQEMRRDGSDQIFHCETCTRILYYVEPPPPASAAAQAPQPQASAAASQAREN